MATSKDSPNRILKHHTNKRLLLLTNQKEVTNNPSRVVSLPKQGKYPKLKSKVWMTVTTNTSRMVTSLQNYPRLHRSTRYWVGRGILVWCFLPFPRRDSKMMEGWATTSSAPSCGGDFDFDKSFMLRNGRGDMIHNDMRSLRWWWIRGGRRRWLCRWGPAGWSFWRRWISWS